MFWYLSGGGGSRSGQQLLVYFTACKALSVVAMTLHKTGYTILDWYYKVTGNFKLTIILFILKVASKHIQKICKKYVNLKAE